MRVLLLALAISGCGAGPKSSGDAKNPQDTESATATATDGGQAASLIESLPLAFETKAALPTCTEAGKNRVAYVKADTILVVCDGAGSWGQSDLNGVGCATPSDPVGVQAKIKNGLTRAQVQAILGDPVSVSGDEWSYDGTDKCATGHMLCSVRFMSGVVWSTFQINPAFVDLTAP